MSDTPIYDRAKAEFDWRGMQMRVVAPSVDFGSDWSSLAGHGQMWAAPESTVSVEILPDTSRFQDVMRVGGRRSGRSAEWDQLVQRALYGSSPTPIYDQLRRERFAESMRRNRAAMEGLMQAARSAVLSGAQLFGLQLAPDRHLILNEAQANALILSTIPDYKPTELFNSMRPFSMQGFEPYMVVMDELSIRSHGISQTNKHYPTSSPSWARKKKR